MINRLKTILLLTFCCGIIACKKTESLPDLPNSKILAYTLPIADGDIIGAVDQQQQTITLYLPYYDEFEVIEPKITLSPGARLLEESKPVSVQDSTVTYTVKGADKSTTTYKLRIVIQQPAAPLFLKELSTATTPASYGVGDNSLELQGVFNTTDIEKIQAFLVDNKGKETAITSSNEFGSAYIRVSFNNTDKKKEYTFGTLRMPTTVDPGLYNIRIKVRGLSTQTQYPVKLEYKRPDIAYRSQTVKSGETFVIKSRGNIFRGFKEFNIMVGDKKVSCPIETYNATSATIRLPKDVPAGDYYPKVLFEGYPERDMFWSLTVN